MPIYKGNTKLGTISRGSTKIGKVYKGSTLVYQGNVISYPVYKIPSLRSSGGNVNQQDLVILKAPTANTVTPSGMWFFPLVSITGTLGTSGSSLVSSNWISPANGNMTYVYSHSVTLAELLFHSYRDQQGGLASACVIVSPKQKAGDYIFCDVLPSTFTCNASVTGGTVTAYYAPGSGLNPYHESITFNGAATNIGTYYYRKA